jgi:hypothetical protein
MTIEDTATCWRDIADQLTTAQVALLEHDEQCAEFSPAGLLFAARDLASENLVDLVSGTDSRG